MILCCAPITKVVLAVRYPQFKVKEFTISNLKRKTYLRGLSKKFVEFVNKNKTTIPITFKFVYNEDTFTTDIITKF